MKEYPVRWIATELAVGYAPRSYKDLGAIRAQGIAAIVNLCAECYDLFDSEKNAGFEVYYVPIPDEDAPALEDLEKALAPGLVLVPTNPDLGSCWRGALQV